MADSGFMRNNESIWNGLIPKGETKDIIKKLVNLVSLDAMQQNEVQLYVMIAICIYIKPSQSYSNDTALYGRELICLEDPVWWP